MIEGILEYLKKKVNYEMLQVVFNYDQDKKVDYMDIVITNYSNFHYPIYEKDYLKHSQEYFCDDIIKKYKKFIVKEFINENI